MDIKNSNNLPTLNLNTEEPTLQINVPSDNTPNQDIIEENDQILHLKSDTNQQKNPKPTTLSSNSQIIEEDWKIPTECETEKNRRSEFL